MRLSRVVYTFGPYTVDAAARRLMLGNAEIALNGKAFELLLILLKSGGAAISRDALYDELWPNAIVEDGNLSQNVYLVRRALDRNGTHYIETVPRFGYRFSVPVRRIERVAVASQARAAVRAAFAALAVVVLAGAGSSAAREERPMSVGAREAYALGTFHLHLRTPHELQYARASFEQTIRLAPQAPAGYAGLASTYALLAEYYADGSKLRTRYVALARAFRDAAFARDPQNSDALAAAGFIAYRFDQNAPQARHYFSAALDSDPDNAAAHHWRGVLLLIEGDTAGAMADMETAHRLDPASEIFLRWLARTFVYARRPGDALAAASEALRIEPTDQASQLIRASAQEELGDLRGALRTLRGLEHNPSEMPFVFPDESRLQARLDHSQIRKLIARIDHAVAGKNVDPFETSLFYLTVGLRDRAQAVLRGRQLSFVAAGLERNDPRRALSVPR